MAHHNLFNRYSYTTGYIRLRNKAQGYKERQVNSLIVVLRSSDSQLFVQTDVSRSRS
jgi:hypothetical protein